MTLLTQTLDEPGLDLAQTLDSLGEAASSAVASFSGLSITATIAGQPQLRITAMTDRRSPVLASLQVALSPAPWPPPVPGRPPAGPPTGADTMTLYAAAAGAFVDLAADIAWLTGADLTQVVLDQHLLPPHPGTPSGLGDMDSIYQAVGVLLTRGHLPEQALRYLDAWAGRRGGNRLAAARHLLANLNGADPIH